MFPPAISISRNAERLRRFSLQTVSNYGELIERQLDMSGQLFIGNCHALQDMFAGQSSVSSLDEWAQAMQEMLQCASKITHEMLETASAHNLEVRRLVDQHAAAAQRFYSDSLQDLEAIGGQRSINDTFPERQPAA